MAQMTDPSDAMTSFQEALRLGEIPLRPGAVDPELYVFADNPMGSSRLTYVRLDGQTVTAFASFVASEPIDGLPCLQLGYAVPESFRGGGRAGEIVEAAIADIRVGLGRNGVPAFYIEAVVGKDNLPSQRVAERAISDSPTEITDSVSGLPARHYLRKIVTAAG